MTDLVGVPNLHHHLLSQTASLIGHRVVRAGQRPGLFTKQILSRSLRDALLHRMTLLHLFLAFLKCNFGSVFQTATVLFVSG